MKHHEHLGTSTLALAAATLLLAFESGCSSSPGAATVGSTQSALSGTVDATAATDCATTYVSCVRSGATTCRADLVACVASGTTTSTSAGDDASADTSETSETSETKSDGGTGTHGKHGGGNCKKDGTIDAAGLESCFSALEACAASTATAESCVADAVTCVTAIATPATTTSDAGAGTSADASAAATSSAIIN